MDNLSWTTKGPSLQPEVPGAGECVARDVFIELPKTFHGAGPMPMRCVELPGADPPLVLVHGFMCASAPGRVAL